MSGTSGKDWFTGLKKHTAMFRDAAVLLCIFWAVLLQGLGAYRAGVLALCGAAFLSIAEISANINLIFSKNALGSTSAASGIMTISCLLSLLLLPTKTEDFGELFLVVASLLFLPPAYRTLSAAVNSSGFVCQAGQGTYRQIAQKAFGDNCVKAAAHIQNLHAKTIGTTCAEGSLKSHQHSVGAAKKAIQHTTKSPHLYSCHNAETKQNAHPPHGDCTGYYAVVYYNVCFITLSLIMVFTALHRGESVYFVMSRLGAATACALPGRYIAAAYAAATAMPMGIKFYRLPSIRRLKADILLFRHGDFCHIKVCGVTPFTVSRPRAIALAALLTKPLKTHTNYYHDIAELATEPQIGGNIHNDFISVTVQKRQSIGLMGEQKLAAFYLFYSEMHKIAQKNYFAPHGLNLMGKRELEQLERVLGARGQIPQSAVAVFIDDVLSAIIEQRVYANRDNDAQAMGFTAEKTKRAVVFECNEEAACFSHMYAPGTALTSAAIENLVKKTKTLNFVIINQDKHILLCKNYQKSPKGFLVPVVCAQKVGAEYASTACKNLAKARHKNIFWCFVYNIVASGLFLLSGASVLYCAGFSLTAFSVMLISFLSVKRGVCGKNTNNAHILYKEA